MKGLEVECIRVDIKLLVCFSCVLQIIGFEFHFPFCYKVLNTVFTVEFKVIVYRFDSIYDSRLENDHVLKVLCKVTIRMVLHLADV